jgi:hypothetical protein
MSAISNSLAKNIDDEANWDSLIRFIQFAHNSSPCLDSTPVFDKLPIRLSSNFNVERGQFLGYIESSNPRPNKWSLSTGSDNRAVDI